MKQHLENLNGFHPTLDKALNQLKEAADGGAPWRQLQLPLEEVTP